MKRKEQICPLCGYRAKSFGELILHMITAHARPIEECYCIY